MLGIKYTAVGPESNSRLQLDRFNFSDESLVVIRQEPTDHVEHGVTEAADVHNVSSFASLNSLVRLQIDADQLRTGFLTCQLALVGNERFPSRHHTGRTVPSCSDPALALAIANENNAGEVCI